MVECEKCNYWFHKSCVPPYNKKKDWFCERCTTELKHTEALCLPSLFICIQLLLLLCHYIFQSQLLCRIIYILYIILMLLLFFYNGSI